MEAIRNYVEALFAALPQTEDILRLKADMLANEEERFNALRAEGKNENEAVGIVITSIGSAEELCAELNLPEADAAAPQPPAADPALAEEYRAYQDKKHLLTGAAVALFILSPILYRVSDKLLHNELLGEVAFFVFIAAGVVLCILADRRDAYYKNLFGLSEQQEDAPRKKGRLTALCAAVLFPFAAVIYLCLGLFGGLWHPGWIIFVLCAALTSAVRALEDFRSTKQ